ncbi:MAB_1171c family putative transporter [Streptomyces sp. NBC_01565]|uniref:MAB_1171c family putative transporter n=1 Tax=Streptomyces sp. NBC_01565 TaxID=2975881 RepID=UPI0022589FD1|nr:MAB_1171c family putative transporter [Streptomyces sp. NBC_01565]MCX4546124.1 hypothetical protein [Streptomyces sp. NBC_01565]
MRGVDYFIPAFALALAFTAKLPALVRTWRSPMVRSVCALIAIGASGWFFAAPPMIGRVNRWTGVPNVSAPLVYGIAAAFSCASIVLVIHWRGGDEPTVRRNVLRWIGGTAVVVVALAVLFALGDAPVERRRDFDTYYATTPFIREAIVTYLAAHTATALVVTTTCWRWASEVPRGWVKNGLLTLVMGFSLNFAFAFLKATAVAARWVGGDLDTLSTDIAPPVGSVGAGLATLGFLLPLFAPRAEETWRAWLSYRRMYPLWRALHAHPAVRTSRMKLPWWSRIEIRATQRATQVTDAIRDLSPFLDTRSRSALEDRAAAEGHTARDVRAMAAAAMVHAALRAPATPPQEQDTANDGTQLLGNAALGECGYEWFATLSDHFVRIQESGPVLLASGAPEST